MLKVRVALITLTHTQTHTHIHTQTQSVGSLCMRYRPLAVQNIHTRNIHDTGHIRTRIASNQAASDLRLTPRHKWNWQLWSYKLEIDRLGGEV